MPVIKVTRNYILFGAKDGVTPMIYAYAKDDSIEAYKSLEETAKTGIKLGLFRHSFIVNGTMIKDE